MEISPADEIPLDDFALGCVAVLDDGQTIAISDDNDFGVGAFTITPTIGTKRNSPK